MLCGKYGSVRARKIRGVLTKFDDFHWWFDLSRISSWKAQEQFLFFIENFQSVTIKANLSLPVG
jgi:hypothetical protein